jgi:diguanylate cyclase (GGDEF)-like protein
MWEISNIGSEAIMERIEITIKESKSEFIAEHIRSDGTYRDVEVHASPVKIDNQLMAFLVVHDITERMRREKEIEYLSFHDQLTGLYNRRFFETEMKRLDTARNLPIAIVMADVNGLKMMNDAFGHQAGDDLLIQAKDVMKSAIRQDDILSRVGGDEFVLLLPKTKLSNAQDLIKRMKHQLEFCQINGMAVSVSFGVAVKEQEDTSIYDTYQKAEDSMYKNKFFESRQLKGNMIDTIMKTLYEKNPRERNHAERVSELCRGMASYLELTEDEINEIGVAGLLHDIGKITLDEVILNKPGFLTESEWKQMRKHPEAGYKILTSVNGLTTIGDYILFHHERWDGTGYPNGIRGEETPYISRIIGLADAFDAMVEDRPYRPTMTYEEAIEEIRGNAGTQFDPILADKFIEWLNTF